MQSHLILVCLAYNENRSLKITCSPLFQLLMAVSLIISHYSHLLHKLQFLEIFMPPDTEPESAQDHKTGEGRAQ